MNCEPIFRLFPGLCICFCLFIELGARIRFLCRFLVIVNSCSCACLRCSFIFCCESLSIGNCLVRSSMLLLICVLKLLILFAVLLIRSFSRSFLARFIILYIYIIYIYYISAFMVRIGFLMLRLGGVISSSLQRRLKIRWLRKRARACSSFSSRRNVLTPLSPNLLRRISKMFIMSL